MREPCAHQRQFSENLLFYHLLDRQGIAMVEARERDCQLDAAFLDRRQNLVTVVQRGGDHFFRENMFACESRPDHYIAMDTGGRIDDDGIDIWLFEQFVEMFIETDSQGCCLCSSSLRVLIPDRNDLCRRMF